MTTDCENYATKGVGFVIFAEEGDVPATGNLSLKVCDCCANEELLKTLFVDNPPGRKMIEDRFKVDGLAVPCWKRSYAEWVDLDDIKHHLERMDKAEEKRIRREVKRQFRGH